MILKTLKTLYYALPFQESRRLYTLRMKLYHQFITRLMRVNYGKIVRKQINGITYDLDLSEAIEASLYYSGVYEYETLKCLKEHLRRDMIVFEIGANVGSHSFEIARALEGGSGRLYCFEPTEYAFHKLLHNHALNGFSNIIFEKIALSDHEHSQTLTPASSLDTMAFAASWDIKNGASKNSTPQTIHFQTIDSYVQAKAIPKVDLLKIDVDGYELKAIQGGMRTIQQHKPLMILEFSSCMLHYVGDSLEELLSVLQDLGYTFQPVYARHQMDRARILQEARERSSFDCLCSPAI